jgi:pyruvate/2-oxoglutarate dehydrogenase complex dihydrolipoamide dehydrogenase (E3) component
MAAVRKNAKAPDQYDVVVVGAGTAGLVAAEFAVAIGAKTALIERERIGGDCTWHGCIPSKTFIRLARTAHEMRTGAAALGIEPRTLPPVDFARVHGTVQAAIAKIYAGETPEALAAKGIDFIAGEAAFRDPHTLALSTGRTLTARYSILATGANARPPALEGIEHVPYLTYRSVFTLKTLPERLVIVGGGPIACEMAQAFARFGAHVTVVAALLLPRDEPEARAVIAAVFAREGIVHLACDAERVEPTAVGVRVTAEDGAAAEGTHLLIATGRTPTFDGLGLEHAGVRVVEGAIGVNSRLQTSIPHIYAVGDCNGGYQFTHYAGWQGFIAVRNALLPLSDGGISHDVPWVTFTDPEIAHAGMTELQARARYGDAVSIARVGERFGRLIDRAVIDGDDDGFIKVVHHHDGRLLGATIVGKGAGEAIAEFTLALHHRMKLGAMAQAFHAYPTYSTAAQLIAADFARDQTLSGLTGTVLKALAR